MQTNYTNHGLSQTLTCTANDVRVARATNISIASGGQCDANGCSCIQGGQVTFTADYEIALSATARYDIGVYFATDGDPVNPNTGARDGALTGQCKLVTLDNNNSLNFVQLDGSPDDCGDINTPHNPQRLRLTLTTLCTPGLDGNLALPNCTSWRQPGSNEVCDDATDAFPGSPSKCNCEPGFTVGITVETGRIEVVKSAVESTIPESGGVVHYNVQVNNLSQVASVTLETVIDDPYGDITSIHDSITATTCALSTIPAGGVYQCQFAVTLSALQIQQQVQQGKITDVVTACGFDNMGHLNLCAHNDASVTVDDVRTPPSLTKTVVDYALAVNVTYEVVVINNSSVDTLTLNSLTDDKFGNITTTHPAGGGFGQIVGTTCSVIENGQPRKILPNSSYICEFTGVVTNSPHADTVTADVTDDDGINFTPHDDATVTVTVGGS
jgi:hypothetical protein